MVDAVDRIVEAAVRARIGFNLPGCVRGVTGDHRGPRLLAGQSSMHGLGRRRGCQGAVRKWRLGDFHVCPLSMRRWWDLRFGLGGDIDERPKRVEPLMYGRCRWLGLLGA